MKRNLLIFGFIFISFVSYEQSIAFQKNFDDLVVPGIPANWNVVDNGNVGFRSDSTNASGNNGASGLNNIVIRNDENTNGSYELITESYDFSSLSGISVMWGSRVSSNFLTSGSELPSFWYSLDNGLTWDSLAYLDNIANSIWSEVNAGALIPLSNLADNQNAVRFKWKINIVGDGATTAGTYRIDDFRIYANQGVVVQELTNKSRVYPNPCSDYLNIDSLEGISSIEVLDTRGELISSNSQFNAQKIRIDTKDWPCGIYFIKMKGNNRVEMMSVLH